jgi:aminoglycoside phosphotransferase (APT) family kinase protein
MDLDQIQLPLQTYFQTQLPQGEAAQVTGLTAISSGWESDVYTFTVARDGLAEKQVLRLYPGDGAEHKATREFEGMQKFAQMGYPVPQVYRLETDRTFFERPFVLMEYIEGELLWPLLFEAATDRQRLLLSQFCQLFVDLHRLAWEPYAPELAEAAADQYYFIDRWLSQLAQRLEQFNLTDFDPVLTWLTSRRDDVPCLNPGPVHLDFHPGNILIQPDGSAVVIDWTQLNVADPRMDLAWTLLLAASHVDQSWRDRILAEYERLAGSEAARIDYFEVLACVKRLLSVVISLRLGPERLGMRPEAAAAMREQLPALRQVYQLLVEKTEIPLPQVAALLEADSA